jgi:hypothetical protein
MSLLTSLLILILLVNIVSSLQFPTEEDCDATHGMAIIGRTAKCRPYPTMEAMMDHITLNGNTLSTIKRLSPSHVIINQCSGM